MDTFDFKMFIRYINKSFININTCDKYDASSSVNEQIKTFFILTTGEGGGRKFKNFLYSRPFWGRENTKKIFLGGGEEKRKR